MEKKEYELEVACRLLARESGWVMLKLEKNGHKGVPDDLLISPEGKCKLIEFKKGKAEHLRYEQKVWFEKYPMLCERVDNIDDFKKLLL